MMPNLSSIYFGLRKAQSMAKIVTIIIDEKGNQTAEANGVIGKGCEGVLKTFGNALGTTEKITNKAEWFKAPLKNLLKR